VKDEEEQN
jgi:hypothetical protein